MKRNFIINMHRYFDWYAKEGVDVSNALFQTIDQAEYYVRNAYDTDREQYTIMEHTEANGWHHIVIAFKCIDDAGDVSYNKHSFHVRFKKYNRVPQVEAIAFSWNNEYWGDTSWNEGSSKDDLDTAWEMLSHINKYFNHSEW